MIALTFLFANFTATKDEKYFTWLNNEAEHYDARNEKFKFDGIMQGDNLQNLDRFIGFLNFTKEHKSDLKSRSSKCQQMDIRTLRYFKLEIVSGLCQYSPRYLTKNVET